MKHDTSKKGRCYWVYNARFLNTQTGRSFQFGYNHGTLFDIDPLDGIEIDISTSQGFQQTGVTVENRSVGGVERQIKGVILGNAANAKNSMMNVFSPMATGKLFFNEKYYCDAVVKTAPAIGVKNTSPSFVITLFCAYPYWLNVIENGYVLGGYTKAFRFPINYATTHRFGTKNPSAFVDCHNNGVVDLPYTATFTALATVKNYGILNAKTFEETKINDTLSIGEKTVIRRENGRLVVKKTVNGKTTDIFSKLDEESDLFVMRPGENQLKATAESGQENLLVSISFSDAFAGVYDGM